jgi:adenosylhomocysteine nucleosidase
VRAAAQTVGVVTGLLVEAHCLSDSSSNPPVYVSAGNAVNAYGGALQLIADGARALLSFGIAGGLDPKLPPGTLVLARAVIGPHGTRFDCDPNWRGMVCSDARGRIEFTDGSIAGRDSPVLGQAGKAKLFRESGAIAVDMESHAVARAAKEKNVPFLALRAIADPARRDVPDWVMIGVDSAGRTRIAPVLAKLLFRPWEIPRLLELAKDQKAALRALRRVADLAALTRF